MNSIIREPKTQFNGVEHAASFVARWRPPEYIVDGIFQRGRVQALTAYTGHTKTTTALHLALCVATGKSFGAADVDQGGVLFLAGENAELVKGQFLAACLANALSPDRLPIYFVDGRFSISEHADLLMKQATNIDNLALIVPDTHQVFFEGDNDNDNMQALAAAQKWRPFTQMPSRPSVLIPTHPSGKKPDRDNLVPRGGGGFLNELDGNFTLWRRDDVVTFHWQGKHRGPSFEPIDLKLELTEHSDLTDAKGQKTPMPVIRPMLRKEKIEAAKAAEATDIRALKVIRDRPKITVRELADEVGVGKSRAGEIIKTLKCEGLLKLEARKYKLTAAGREYLDG